MIKLSVNFLAQGPDTVLAHLVVSGFTMVDSRDLTAGELGRGPLRAQARKWVEGGGRGKGCTVLDSYLQEAFGYFARNQVVLVIRDALPLVLALEAQSTEVPILIQGLVEHPVHGIGMLCTERFQAQAHFPIGPSCP